MYLETTEKLCTNMVKHTFLLSPTNEKKIEKMKLFNSENLPGVQGLNQKGE